MDMQLRYGVIDYIGKCATCRFFERNKNPTIRDGKCKGRYKSRGFCTYSARCKDWALDPDTICTCNIFIESWYRFCPNCGKKLSTKGA